MKTDIFEARSGVCMAACEGKLRYLTQIEDTERPTLKCG